MRNVLILFILSAFIVLHASAQVKFVNPPLSGVGGQDYYIVNYPDKDAATSAIKDPFCGTKTYDGHQGTDFCIRSFKTMDSGVTVRAVASGRVFVTKDSLFDRNKHSNTGGFGNYIGINHQYQYYTYYAHLMKYTLLVKVGDSVTAGQAIAKVGCSGDCTDPHVHLEVWDNAVLVDPWAGTCQTATPSMWQTQPVYDTTRRIIDLGFVPYVPNLDTLRERYLVRDNYYINQDTTVCFWIQMQGIHANDSQRVDWYDNNGAFWFTYTYKATNDGWYYYYWTYINMPKSPGTWTAKYYINNQFIAQRNFYVQFPSGIDNTAPENSWTISPNPCINEVNIMGKLPADKPVVLTDISGRELNRYAAETKAISLADYPQGMYFIRCGSTVKKLIKL
ncbi:MAG: peptidoglycan DD-metalloendopeptidase family protein [Bacteroidetes bacterium]|nr:peptidoglycan DD-metalloendopeptidase family protein [Bacteroidota bacterium]